MSKAKFNPTSLTMLSLKKIHAAFKDSTAPKSNVKSVRLVEQVDPETGLLVATRLVVEGEYKSNLGGCPRLSVFAADREYASKGKPEAYSFDDQYEIALFVELAVSQKSDVEEEYWQHGTGTMGYIRKELPLAKLKSAGKESSYQSYQEVLNVILAAFDQYVESTRNVDALRQFENFRDTVWKPAVEKYERENGEKARYRLGRPDDYVRSQAESALSKVKKMFENDPLFDRRIRVTKEEANPSSAVDTEEPEDDYAA